MLDGGLGQQGRGQIDEQVQRRTWHAWSDWVRKGLSKGVKWKVRPGGEEGGQPCGDWTRKAGIGCAGTGVSKKFHSNRGRG